MQNRQSLHNLLEKMLSVLESKEQKGSVAGPSKRQRKPLGSKGHEASGETDESFWSFDFISRFGAGGYVYYRLCSALQNVQDVQAYLR